jgi:hypothetical protein
MVRLRVAGFCSVSQHATGAFGGQSWILDGRERASRLQPARVLTS